MEKQTVAFSAFSLVLRRGNHLLTIGIPREWGVSRGER